MPAPRAPAPAGPGPAGALLLGVLCVQGLPALPPWPLSLGCLLLGAGLWFRTWRGRASGALLTGLALACLHGQASLALRLPPELAGRVLQVEGRVLGLPVHDDAALRFEFLVERGDGPAAALADRRLRLGWYAHPPDTLPRLEAGSRWRLPVKLRRPRGLLNPGGFDAERRALEQRLSATGHVVTGAGPREIEPGHGLDRIRENLARRMHDAVPGPGARYVPALALGDTRGLSGQDWDVLRATGLTHLIAISGFHVGLVAGFGALLGRGLWLAWPALGRRWPRPVGIAASAFGLAAAYTALAGFALPTVRTLLMIAVVLLARGLRRPSSVARSLALALVAVLLVDPLSVLAPGFWLSFLGVAWLVWCLPDAGGQGWFRSFLASQGVAMLGLLPVSAWFFHQASLAGPLVNLVGIPWISLGVVPLCLVGLALLPMSESLAAACWQAAAAMMHGLDLALVRIAAWPPALAWLPEPGALATALALAGAFWLLLPRGVPGKVLAALLFLPLLWPRLDRPGHGEFELVLLDVGQGLSLLVLTQHHAMLYDAGPAPHRGPDHGEIVVVPALRALGLRRLDRLVLSHGDNDHAGGEAAVRRAFAPAQVLAAPGGPGARDADCEAGQAWQWDGVRFEVLHPPRYFPYQRNESSCVLRIEAGGTVALLPGDIGRHVEARLARLPPARVRADLLLVPHHGSRTSSSLDFIAAVRPRLGLVAVGQGNRFGLPNPRVLARYHRYGVPLHDSAGSGAIRLRLGPGGVQVVERLRADRPRYWRDAGSGGAGYAIGDSESDR